MKTFLTIISLVLLTNICNAQFATAIDTQASLTVTPRIHTSHSLNTIADSRPATYIASHSQSAMEQIRAYLVQQVTYPADMIQHGIEGKVQLAVAISPAGTILNAEVVKGLNPALDAEIVKQVHALEAVDTAGVPYEGERKVYLSIRLRLNP